MTDEIKLSDEEKQTIWAQQELESIKFMRKTDFVPNTRNSETMGREIAKRGLNWTCANLCLVYDEIKDSGILDDTIDNRPPARELPSPPAPVAQETPVETYPWGPKLEGSAGKTLVAQMTKEDYKKYLTDKQWGAEFQNQVNNLRIKKGEINVSH